MTEIFPIFSQVQNDLVSDGSVVGTLCCMQQKG